MSVEGIGDFEYYSDRFPRDEGSQWNGKDVVTMTTEKIPAFSQGILKHLALAPIACNSVLAMNRCTRVDVDFSVIDRNGNKYQVGAGLSFDPPREIEKDENKQPDSTDRDFERDFEADRSYG